MIKQKRTGRKNGTDGIYLNDLAERIAEQNAQ